MFGLVGSYPVKIDDKGRMRLPSKLLEKLGNGGTCTQFYLARGAGKCLSLYTQSSWEEETNKLSKLNLDVAKNLILVRSFFLGATEVSLDSADRISLNQMQLNTAEIKDAAVIHTFLNKMEIWSKENYANGNNLLIDDFAILRENAMTGNVTVVSTKNTETKTETKAKEDE